METNVLKAFTRDEAGKGSSRKLRQKGLIPAVFYGPQSKSIPITIQSSDLLKLLKEGKDNKFIKLSIDRQGKSIEKLSMIKEFQIEPVGRQMIHADFYEVSMDHKLTMDIPIHFKGTPVGIEEGGELLHVKREIKISCLPNDLPEFIEVDVSQLNIGDSIKIQDIHCGEHVTILDQEDTTIALVATAKTKEEPVEGEEGVSEPELVGKADENQEEEN